MTASGPVIDWLLDSDPSIRWQVMRDLLDAPEADWRAERGKVERMDGCLGALGRPEARRTGPRIPPDLGLIRF